MTRARINQNWRPPKPPYAGITTALLASKRLSGKEREFLQQIAGYIRLTAEQQKWLNMLMSRPTRDDPPRRRRSSVFTYDDDDDLDDEIPF